MIHTSSEHPSSSPIVILTGHAAFWKSPTRSSLTVGASAGAAPSTAAWSSVIVRWESGY